MGWEVLHGCLCPIEDGHLDAAERQGKLPLGKLKFCVEGQ